jgi:predicted amidohydrolase YtcJ
MRTEADLLIENARLWTDGACLEDADALAVGGGEVVAVGRRADLAALAGPRTRRVDARGGTVTPGLWDAHIHLTTWARSRAQLDLRGAADRNEALRRVRKWVATHPGATPVVGRGWDARTWSAPPERAALDAVAGDRPVMLHSHDFHALWVNGAALREARVSRATADPEGGRFERDAAGEPSGLVREHAVRAFAALEARGATGDDDALARDAAAELHAHGIVGVHDMDPGALPHRVLRGLALAGLLRVLKAVGHLDLDHALALGLASGTGDDRFRVGPLKLFADGTLGSQTAAMLEPYEGGGTGMTLMPAAELRETVARALAGGLAVAVHAIGDRAVRDTLDAFEAVGAAMPRAALPWRIEHVQIARREDLARFAALGVAASVQPQHCTSDIELIETHWGSRRDRAYPFESLRVSGALLAFGSDAPVEPPDSAAMLHAAVSRQRADRTPPGGFVAGERVTLDAALTACTEGPARLAGVWPRTGRLAVGAAADAVVWDADLHLLPRCDLHRARVSHTLLGGRMVYSAAPAAVTTGGAR